MQTIDKELNRISAALRQPCGPDQYTQLYAAQQALSWAKLPDEFMSPYDAIVSGRVIPLINDTPADSEDC